MNTKEGSSNKVQRGLQILSIVSGSGRAHSVEGNRLTKLTDSTLVFDFLLFSW